MFARCVSALHRTGGKTAWEPVSMSAPVNVQCVRWRKQRTDPPPKNKVIIKRRPVPNEWKMNSLRKEIIITGPS